MSAIKKVLIVGGGSAGWITAAYMNSALNGRKTMVDITLVESAAIGRIGVGEATVPTIRQVLQSVGISETEFMKKTDATFKQAIRFDDWHHVGDGGYYHPFQRRPMARIDRAGADWLMSDRSIPYAETVSVQPQFSDLGLSPRMAGSKDFGSPFPYAYHMDAEKFADYLRDISVTRGVTHHIDDVTEVVQAENGDVSAVKTKGGLSLEADLFIDCTGFASLLSGKTLNTDFTDYGQWLLCDRAVAMRVPYDTHYPGEVKPYTTATALSHGWKWDIGLTDRRGIGYVYSSQFLSDDEAEVQLRAQEGDHTDGIDARRLKFRVGMRPKPWTKNCVAIGLSGGFIEPLESTGLYLIEFAAITLCEHFPFGEITEPLSKRFNEIMGSRYGEILDFINMHYCLTKRDDTEFWREVQKDERITDSLKAKFDFWRFKPPSHSDFDDQLRLFSHQSYEYVLYGMDFQVANGVLPPGYNAPPLVPADVRNIVEAGKTRLPKHADFLSQTLGRRIGA